MHLHWCRTCEMFFACYEDCSKYKIYSEVVHEQCGEKPDLVKVI